MRFLSLKKDSKVFMKIIIFPILLFVLSSCTNQIKESQELRNEVRSLEIEISSLYGTAGYKFGQAMEYFDGKITKKQKNGLPICKTVFLTGTRNLWKIQ